MRLENIKVAQALAYQLERVDSDIEMVGESVSSITIRTDDDYSYSLAACDNNKAAMYIKDILMKHLHTVRVNILQLIDEID